MYKMELLSRDLSKKTYKMRENGLIPGVVYGPSVKTMAIKSSYKNLMKALDTSGEVYETSSKEDFLPKGMMVKVDEVQKHPVTGEILHFTLVELPMGQETEVEVPVDIIGTPVGVKNGGVLVITKDQVLVSGTPKKMPKKITGNVKSLDIGDKLIVDDLKLPKKVNFTTDENEVIAVCKAPTLQKTLNIDESGITEGLTESSESEVEKAI